MASPTAPATWVMPPSASPRRSATAPRKPVPASATAPGRRVSPSAMARGKAGTPPGTAPRRHSAGAIDRLDTHSFHHDMYVSRRPCAGNHGSPMSEATDTLLAVDENKLIAERREKLQALRTQGVAFPNDFQVADFAG